jgi:hypothetical protein
MLGLLCVIDLIARFFLWRARRWPSFGRRPAARWRNDLFINKSGGLPCWVCLLCLILSHFPSLAGLTRAQRLGSRGLTRGLNDLFISAYGRLPCWVCCRALITSRFAFFVLPDDSRDFWWRVGVNVLLLYCRLYEWSSFCTAGRGGADHMERISTTAAAASREGLM